MYDEANAPKIVNRNKDIKFSERSCCNKMQRFTFKTMRGIYISVTYYFNPFLFLYLHMIFLLIMDVNGYMDW